MVKQISWEAMLLILLDALSGVKRISLSDHLILDVFVIFDQQERPNPEKFAPKQKFEKVAILFMANASHHLFLSVDRFSPKSSYNSFNEIGSDNGSQRRRLEAAFGNEKKATDASVLLKEFQYEIEPNLEQ